MTPRQKTAQFRFYEELNDFLTRNRKKKTFTYHFWGNPSVKDAIEAIGVPHTEIEIIIANGISVGFDYHLQNEDRIAVYPVFESLDISPLVHLRPEPLRVIRFILDVHLGKLTRLLRMLGFDSLYRTDYSDREIRMISADERRIILTRDQDLLKAGTVARGYWLRSIEPLSQIAEVIKRFDLKSRIRPFTRCLDCNGLIVQADLPSGLPDIPAHARTFYHEFFRCTECKKIYWPGSHYQRMNDKINRILAQEDE